MRVFEDESELKHFKEICSNNNECMSRCCNSEENSCAYYNCIRDKEFFIALIILTIVVLSCLIISIFLLICKRHYANKRERTRYQHIQIIAS